MKFNQIIKKGLIAWISLIFIIVLVAVIYLTKLSSQLTKSELLVLEIVVGIIIFVVSVMVLGVTMFYDIARKEEIKMNKIIYGSELAQELRQLMKQEIDQLIKEEKRVPHLTVVIVGDNPASLSYVKGKEKASKSINMSSKIIALPKTITQSELVAVVDQLNHDSTVDGILIQLPLPKHLDERFIVDQIDPAKDVDGLTAANVARLYLNDPYLVPCTPLGIMEIIKRMGIDLCGKEVCVLGRSELVGKPVSKLLLDANATVTMCHSKTANLSEVTKRADVLIVAVGKAKMVKKSWLKNGAYVIDVGVNRVDGKLCGDVDFEDCLPVVSAITPVPKGVGPMTITMLLHNTLKAYKENN